MLEDRTSGEKAHFPIANPQLEVSPLDTNAVQPMSICELPSDEGRIRYAVPTAVVELIRLFNGTRAENEAIAVYEERYPGRYEHERLKSLVSGFLMSKGLVLPNAHAKVDVRRSPDHRRSFLYIKLPLMTSRFVDPVANTLKWCYTRLAFACWIPALIFIHVYFYSDLLPGHNLDFNQLHVGDILLLMLLSTIGTFIHEFGHASAAAYYGCRHLEVGWGLYLVFTIMYTDVSDAWRLPRRQRAVVDIGGVYFESLFLMVLLALFVATQNTIFLFAFLFTDLSILSSFNPFLRLDGYWLVSDLFGIVNLRQQSLDLMRLGAAKLLRLPSLAGDRPAIRLGKRAVAVLVTYSVLGLVAVVVITKILVEHVIIKVLVGLPDVVAELWVGLSFRDLGALEIVSGMAEVVWRSLMLMGVTFFLFNVLNSARKAVWKHRHVLSSRLAVSSEPRVAAQMKGCEL